MFRSVHHCLVVGIQFRRESAAKNKIAVEILARDAILKLPAQTKSESPGVTASKG